MKLSVRFWNVIMACVLVLGAALAMPSQAAVQAAAPTELFFSEYIEGSSNNKALEIFNGHWCAAVSIWLLAAIACKCFPTAVQPPA